MRVNKILLSGIALTISFAVIFLPAACSDDSSAKKNSTLTNATINVTTVVTSDPSTSIKLTWQGDAKTIQYAVKPESGSPDFSGASTLTADTVVVPDNNDRNSEAREGYNYNQVTITKLTPDTEYAYKIDEIEGTFKTAPSDGSFSFVYFSDPQVTIDNGLADSDDQPKYLAAAFNDIMNNIKNEDAEGDMPYFACTTGDYTDYYRNDEFDVLFNTGKEFFANTLIAGAEGNHDYNNEDYFTATHFLEDYFGFPSTTQSSYTLKNTYSFDYGVAHFIVLNSNYIFETFSNKAQLSAITTWLTSDLAASETRGKIWNIVLTHGSAYCAGGHASDVGDIADTYAKLFEDNGVDVVLSGHDHDFARGFIKYSSTAETKGEKVVPAEGALATSVTQPSNVPFYMTGGTMGECKWYELDATYAALFNKADALDGIMVYNFIKVDSDSIQINIRTLDTGSVSADDAADTTWTDYDTYTISK